MDARLTNAEQTINFGNKALNLAISMNFTRGIAESYRIRGIGEYYMNMPEDAINSFIEALKYFLKINAPLQFYF